MSDVVPDKIKYLVDNVVCQYGGRRKFAWLREDTGFATRVFLLGTLTAVSPQYSTVEEINSPLSRLTVIDQRVVRSRKEYLVKDLLNRVHRMLDDIFLEAIMSEGMTSDGILNGEFIWAQVPYAGLTLVRVGSRLHSTIMSIVGRKGVPKLKLKDVPDGSIVVTGTGKVEVYLGTYKSLACAYTDRWVDNGERPDLPLFYRPQAKVLKNLPIGTIEMQSAIELRLATPERHGYYWNNPFYIKGTHAFREIVGRVQVPDLLSKIKHLSVQELNIAYQETLTRRYWDNEQRRSDVIDMGMKSAVYLNICEIDSTPVMHEWFGTNTLQTLTGPRIDNLR